jgi:hypothetical protein
MVMEDLSSHRIWRGELIKNNTTRRPRASWVNISPTRCSTPAISTCIRTRKKRR